MPTKDIIDKPKKKKRYYYLWYSVRGSKMLEKIFELNENLQEAINEGRRHCDIMNYRFFRVRPAIVDLRDQEDRKLNDPKYDEVFEEQIR